MSEHGVGPNGEAYTALVSLTVNSADDIGKQIGAGGMFLRHADPPAVGSLVAVDFLDPDGNVLSRVSCRVKPTPAAVADAGPGMALDIVHLDGVATSSLRNVTAHRDRGDQVTGKIDQIGASFFESTAQGPVIGIDLGTTNSCFAVVKDGGPEVLTSPGGYETVPSVLYVGEDKKVAVGHKAVEKMALDPNRGIYGSKRFIGRPFASNEVKTYGHFFNWELAEDQRGWTAAKLGETVVSLEVVAAAILKHIRAAASQQLGESVQRAVITVPAYFGETQRQAVRRAGELAGLAVERILNEPTAGAVAFGYGKKLSKTILVYDLGGGTFDVSVLQVDGDRMEVLATDGGPFLGGSDFDDRLTEHIAACIEREHQINVRSDPVALQRVRSAAEDAKRQLSAAESTTIDLPFLAQTSEGAINAAIGINRAELEGLTRDLVDRTLTIVQSVLDVAKVPSSKLDDVIMIGGQSRSPLIRKMLAERFGKQPTRGVHPDHAVALGAAIVAAAAFEEVEMELTDVIPASIRLRRNGVAEVIVPRGKALPVMATLEVQPDADGAFRVELFRGESDEPTELEPIGSISLPGGSGGGSNGEAASVLLLVNNEGILSVTAEHPDTGQEEEFEIELIENAGSAEANSGEFLSW